MVLKLLKRNATNMENQIVTHPVDSNKVIQGETVTELVRRHMRDKNHTTTDEELRNVKLELGNQMEEKSPTDGNAEK